MIVWTIIINPAWLNPISIIAKSEKYKTIIGHWSSLGYFENKNLISIDTGCAWGRELTAIKLLQDKKIKKYQIKC